MGQVILNIRLAVIAPEKSRHGLDEDWAEPIKKSAPRAYKRLRETLPDIKTVIEKVIKPRIEGTRRMFKKDPAYLVRYTRAELEEMARNYLKGVKRGFKQETYDEAIELSKKDRARKLARLVIPFSGSRKDKIRGLGPLAARILTGDKNVAGELIGADKLYQGGAVDITRPDKKGEFRSKCSNRIVQAGSRIMKALDKRKVIKRENVLTNKLANKFIPKNIVPFSPGGPSHIDFVIIDGNLYLEIQVAQK